MPIAKLAQSRAAGSSPATSRTTATSLPFLICAPVTPPRRNHACSSRSLATPTPIALMRSSSEPAGARTSVTAPNLPLKSVVANARGKTEAGSRAAACSPSLPPSAASTMAAPLRGAENLANAIVGLGAMLQRPSLYFGGLIRRRHLGLFAPFASALAIHGHVISPRRAVGAISGGCVERTAFTFS